MLIGARAMPAGQTDLAPTLLALLGIDPAPLPYLGRNLLGRRRRSAGAAAVRRLARRDAICSWRASADASCYDLAAARPSPASACADGERARRGARAICRGSSCIDDLQPQLRARLAAAAAAMSTMLGVPMRVLVTLSRCSCSSSLSRPALAQDPPPPIPWVVVDLHASMPRFPSDDADLAASRGMSHRGAARHRPRRADRRAPLPAAHAHRDVRPWRRAGDRPRAARRPTAAAPRRPTPRRSARRGADHVVLAAAVAEFRQRLGLELHQRGARADDLVARAGRSGRLSAERRQAEDVELRRRRAMVHQAAPCASASTSASTRSAPASPTSSRPRRA